MPAETQPWLSDLIPGAIVFVIALGVLGYLFRRMRRTQKSVYRPRRPDPRRPRLIMARRCRVAYW